MPVQLDLVSLERSIDLNCLYLFQVHEPKQKVDLTKYLENHKFW